MFTMTSYQGKSQTIKIKMENFSLPNCFIDSIRLLTPYKCNIVRHKKEDVDITFNDINALLNFVEEYRFCHIKHTFKCTGKRLLRKIVTPYYITIKEVNKGYPGYWFFTLKYGKYIDTINWKEFAEVLCNRIGISLQYAGKACNGVPYICIDSMYALEMAANSVLCAYKYVYETEKTIVKCEY